MLLINEIARSKNGKLADRKTIKLMKRFILNRLEFNFYTGRAGKANCDNAVTTALDRVVDKFENDGVLFLSDLEKIVDEESKADTFDWNVFDKKCVYFTLFN